MLVRYIVEMDDMDGLVATGLSTVVLEIFRREVEAGHGDLQISELLLYGSPELPRPRF